MWKKVRKQIWERKINRKRAKINKGSKMLKETEIRKERKGWETGGKRNEKKKK